MCLLCRYCTLVSNIFLYYIFKLELASTNINTCFGIASTNSSVCGGNGYCFNNNTCQCFAGYAPPDCSQQILGFAFATGSNSVGQQGDGFTTSTEISPPTGLYRIGSIDWFSLYNFSSISSGDQFTLALTTSGNVYAWGENTWGNLGTGDTTNRLLPTLIEGSLQNKTIISIAACVFHSLAVDDQGQLYAWGSQQDPISGARGPPCSGSVCTGPLVDFGWLGTGDSTIPHYFPTPVLMNGVETDIAGVYCGRRHSLALTRSNNIWGWGSSQDYQLGNADSING